MPPRFSCLPATRCSRLALLLLLSTTPLAGARHLCRTCQATRRRDGSIASDLNPAGLVAGIITEEEGRRRAVVYQHGRIRELAPGGE
jgi:hypothetical protein